MNRKTFTSAVVVPAPVPTRPHVVLLLLLGLAAMVLSGCLMQPIVAGPLRQAPLPSDQGPIIAIAPIAAASGDTVSVSGAGWEANEVIFVTSIGVRSGEANQSKCEAGSDKCDFGRWILHGQGLSKWFRDLTRESAAYAHSAIKVEKFSFSPGELML